MARTSCSALLALVPLTLVCGTSKAEDEPVEYDRTAVLAKLDEATAKTDDPEVKRALKKMRERTERSNKLLTLSGLRTLPPEIGQLTNLTGLSLHGVQFTTLPSEIGKLTKLVYLGLGENQFTKLPPEIGQLTNLLWLYLEGNQLTTLPPEIGKLTKLTELQIDKNPVADTGLEHLKSLKSLRRLNLRDTKVTLAGVEAFRKALPNCEVKVPSQNP